jgi:hypothetical protein
MPFNIDNTQLRTIAQFIQQYTPPFYNEVTMFVSDLYVTGCRPQELLQTNRWTQSIIDSDYWTLTPEKNNDTREIQKSILSDNLTFAIENQIRPYNDLTQRQLEYSIQQINPVARLFADTKIIIAYLYRYNKVREMLDDGITQNEISTAFGWIAPTILASYTTKQISIAEDTTPAEQYLLWNNNLDVIVDNDGTYVVSS